MKFENQFEEGWYKRLSPFLHSQQFKYIGKTLTIETKLGHSITPLFDDTFRAFKECSFDNTKVVLLGLDPYPAKGVADGLAFSSRTADYNNPPKSLDFILDAMEKDEYGGFGIGFNQEYCNPDLTRWANQGVLLLNLALSTRIGETGSHLELWAPFIREVFKVLQEKTTVVYIFLGAKARQWKVLVNQDFNYTLETSHPSSCNYNGKKVWDCEQIFSKTNEILRLLNGEENKILW